MIDKFNKPRLADYTDKYTPDDELDKSVYIDYRNHLSAHREYILTTGYPPLPFTTYLNLDLRLSKTLPTKLPMDARGGGPFYRDMDYIAWTPDIYSGIDEFSYSWSTADPLPNFREVWETSKKLSPNAVVRHVLPRLSEEKECTFEEAAHMHFLGDEEPETIGLYRATLFDLKLEILDRMIETLDQNRDTGDFTKSALSIVSEALSLEELEELMNIEDRYTQNYAGIYLNKLLLPKVQHIEQRLAVEDVQVPSGITPKNKTLHMQTMLNIGGISDILFSIGTFAEKKRLYSVAPPETNDPEANDPESRKEHYLEIMELRHEYWKELKCFLEQFIEKLTERSLTITASLKGKYIRKYLPVLEKMTGIEADYINETGEILNSPKPAEQSSPHGRSEDSLPTGVSSPADSHFPDSRPADSHSLDSSPADFRLKDYLFRKAGEGFEIAFAGKPSFFLPETAGLNYIYTLLNNKNKAISVQELVRFQKLPNGENGGSIDREADSPNSEGGSGGKEYSSADLKHTINELQKKREEKEEANEFGAYEKAERLIYEIEDLEDYLREAQNTKHDPELEKKRTNVQNNIRSAIERIKTCDPDLAGHLNEKINTGYTCIYSISPDDPIEWRFE